MTALSQMTAPRTCYTLLGRKKQGRWISKAMWWSSDRAKWGLYLEIIQKLLGEGKTALSHWDRFKRVLKGHHDILLRSGLTVSKLFFFKCLSSPLLNTAVLNFHGAFVLLPDSPYCQKAFLRISRSQNEVFIHTTTSRVVSPQTDF